MELSLDQALQKGIEAHRAGKVQEADQYYTAILKANPKHSDANHNMGVLAVSVDKVNEALPFFKAALEANPSIAQYWLSYIDAFIKLDRMVEAKAVFDQAKSKGAKGDGFDKLEERFGSSGSKSSDAQNPSQAQIQSLINLHTQAQYEEGLSQASQLLIEFPKSVILYNIIGAVNQGMGKLDEAIAAYNKALTLKPDYAEAYNNMGNALNKQGKFDEAIEAYTKAHSIKPDYAEAHYNRGLAFLIAKDFYQGFLQYEWRWKTNKKTFLQSAKPIWNGEKNQRVLVWAEQGIGDELMYSSIISELYVTSLKILVKCDKRLIPLFKRSFPADIIYFSKDLPVPEDEYDFHIPMGSLPMIFRKSLDSFKKSASGFLKYDMSKTESIKAQLMHEYGKKIIGISWKTTSPNRSSLSRNIDLAKLVTALENSNTQLLSLQYGDISDEIEAVKRDFGIEVIQFSDVDNKNDIDGLAALMAACDTVITIDNSTAHLSGALGLTTKLMLPYTADWRWGLSGNSSYWYDAVQLYRQSEVNDWYSVLAQIKIKSPILKRI